MRGLPPLVRGAPARSVRGRQTRGPTPAGAGSTSAGLVCRALRWAYPRWCGEHEPASRVCPIDGGLPPLVRGARSGRRRGSPCGGPTPAGAGSTSIRGQARRPGWAYPRWCGEHPLHLVPTDRRTGLPPLVRGARIRSGGVRAQSRPTPAGAGSTAAPVLGSTPCWAYPRWCGEHPRGSSGGCSWGGLPPLVRGAPQGASSCAPRPGPTPAGAGSTRPGRTPATRMWAYPRWCGEHELAFPEWEPFAGLPPLVRGAQLLGRRQAVLDGPTPAGAGSTPARAMASKWVRAYPRWCGEHWRTFHRLVSTVGLPPLVRGAPLIAPACAPAGGPTPAGAGSTRSAGAGC